MTNIDLRIFITRLIGDLDRQHSECVCDKFSDDYWSPMYNEVKSYLSQHPVMQEGKEEMKIFFDNTKSTEERNFIQNAIDFVSRLPVDDEQPEPTYEICRDCVGFGKMINGEPCKECTGYGLRPSRPGAWVNPPRSNPSQDLDTHSMNC